MRVYGVIALLLVLSACAVSPPLIPDVSGNWLDQAAEVITCGETFPVTVGLELTQAGNQLTGTFASEASAYPFTGTLGSGYGVSGEVRGDGGSGLIAALSFQQNRLVGTFTAIEEIPCTAGGTSLTVYKVNLAR